MKRLFLVTASMLAVLAATGCEQDVPDRTKVDQLRILGVRAEPPEAAPGGTVTLDALVVDPVEQRPITLTWAFCTPDPSEGVSSCTDEANIQPLGAGTSATVTIAGDALAGLPPEVQERGIDAYVVLIAEAGEASELAYKKLRLSTSATPNANPGLDSFLVDDADVDPTEVAAGAKVTLVAVASSGSQQTYVDSVGEPQTEETRFSWLQTEGTLEDAVSFGNDDGEGRTTWEPKGTDPATLWVVLRDQRGGIAWRSKQIVVVE